MRPKRLSELNIQPTTGSRAFCNKIVAQDSRKPLSVGKKTTDTDGPIIHFGIKANYICS